VEEYHIFDAYGMKSDKQCISTVEKHNS